MSIDDVFKTFPQFETKNLLLRKINSGDAEALYTILSKDEVTEFYDEDAFIEISQASDQIAAWEEGYYHRRCIRWGIVPKGEKALIGTCGYYGIHNWNKRASIGYELSQRYWRRNIMTESLSGILDFGFAKMDLNRIDALVMPENIASINLLEKLGFRNDGLLEEYERWGEKGFVDLYMFALIRKTWIAG